MPTIISIKPAGKRRGRVLVHFNDGPEPVELSGEISSRAGLAVGRDLEAAEISDLCHQDEELRCRQKAWDLLARKARSRSELTRALARKGFQESIIQTILDRIESLGHIDDSALARDFAERHATKGGYGPALVKNKLAGRGIAPEIIEQALPTVSAPDVQIANAEQILRKWNRRPRPEDPFERRQKAGAYLMRRGFDTDVVREVVDRVLARSWQDESEQH